MVEDKYRQAAESWNSELNQSDEKRTSTKFPRKSGAELLSGHGFSDSKVLKQRLADARRQIMLAERDRKAAQDRARRLQEELEVLRNVLEEYVAQPQGEDADGGEEREALRAELELVRGQAALDMQALRDELMAAQAQAGLAVNAKAAEEERSRLQAHTASLNQALRQKQSEIETLRPALDASEKKRQKLENDHTKLTSDYDELRNKLEAQVKPALADKRTTRRIKALDAANKGGRGIFMALLLGMILGVVSFWALAYAYQNFNVTNRKMSISIDQVLEQPKSIVRGLFKRHEAIEPPGSHQESVVADANPVSLGQGLSAPKAGLVTTATVAIEQRLTDQKSAHTDSTQSTDLIVIRDRLQQGGKGPRMIKILANRFLMGSHQGALFPNEEPPHEVTLGTYYVSEHEVSFAQYDLFARDQGIDLPEDPGWGRGSYPVVNVDWNEANAYVQWLSAQTGKRYRLPSEAEWEYAAAGGSNSFYWWGNHLGYNHAVCFNCGSKWDRTSAAPVGSLEPNRYGLHDTAGNVMEWVSDCYHKNYHGAPRDGGAWVEPECGFRVARGGAYNRPAERLRTTSRTKFAASTRLDMLGFRVVRE